MPTCSRAFTLNVTDADMPLSDAIYIAPHIYGVRGGYLFEFDANGASTGRKLVFGEPVLGDSLFATDPSGNVWASLPSDPGNMERIPSQGFYKFNLTAMSVSEFHAVDGSSNLPLTLNDSVIGGGAFQGPRAFAFNPDGTVIFISLSQMGGVPLEASIFKIAADFGSTILGGNWGFAFEYGQPNCNRFYNDVAAGKVWVSYDSGLATLQDNGGGGWTPTTYAHYVRTNHMLGAVYGFDYAPSVDNFFAVSRSTDVLVLNKTNPGGGYTVISIAASRPNAKPRNIKYVAYKDRLYVPTMQDNAVVEINPNTNTVTNVFTGFDLPWSIVDTGSKVFAVQLGSTGLRLVTT